MSTSTNSLENSLFDFEESSGATLTTSLPTSSHAPVSMMGEVLQNSIQEYEQEISGDDKAAFQSTPNIIERLQEMQCKTHERHLKKRFERTGQWLLDDSRFRNWKDETQSSLLWCYGASGSGKTILASLVIEYLSALYRLSADTGITFVYCSYKEPQTATTYLRLALKQLCRTIQFLPFELQEIYKKHYHDDNPPKYDELRTVFLAIIRQVGCIFFVLDALDECTPNQRKDLCKFILSIANTTSTGPRQGIVKIFITSRKGCKESDIYQAFQQNPIPIIEVETAKVNSDIEAYTKAQIELRLKNGSLKLRDEALESRILSVLTSKAGGVFLWVDFQLDAICAEISDNGIEEALRSLPDDMDATYGKILDTINAKSRTQHELVRRALVWTAYARRPLSIDSLAYAISIEMDTKSLEELESSIPTEESILDMCANLISVDQSQNRYVQFVHSSVQEFLTRHHSVTLSMGYEPGHREIAQACMIFLTLFPNPLSKKCIHQYAFDEWPHHLLAGNLSSQPAGDHIVTRTSSFLQKRPIVPTKQPELEGYWSERKERTYFKFSPRVLALIFDVPGIHEQEPEEEQPSAIYDHELNSIVLSNDNLVIHYAAEIDSVCVANRLYKHGYALNYSYSDRKIQDWLQLPPLYSVQSTQMARYLLDNGVSIEPQVLRDKIVDPLKHFAQKGNLSIQVFQLLLDRVVNQDAGRLEDVLQDAAYHGKIEVIRLLLGKGVDIHAQGGRYGSALHAAAAAYGDNVKVIQLLLDTGADVHAQCGTYGSALQAAAYGGSVKAVQLLLDKGADINAQGGMYGYALQAAAYKGEVKIIRLLLDKGADVNARGGTYENALQAAAYSGQVEVIRLLLDRGASVNARGGEYGTVLQAAVVWTGKVEVIQILLEKGADVNAKGGKYGHALQAAAIGMGKLEVIQLLLNRGVDVNAQGGEYGNALQAAAYRGEVEVIQLLLNSGADINAQGGEYGNALQAAAYRGEVKIIRLLLGEGADVNARGGTYGNALQAAVAGYGGDMRAIRLLLDGGANVNAQGGEYGNAITAATYRDKVEVIQLLMDNGADVNAAGGKYGSALEKMLALMPVGAGPTVPADIPRVVEVLQDHASALGSEYENTSMMELYNRFMAGLDVVGVHLENADTGLRRLRRAKGNEGGDPGRLEAEQEPHRNENEVGNDNGIEAGVRAEAEAGAGAGAVVGNETRQWVPKITLDEYVTACVVGVCALLAVAAGPGNGQRTNPTKWDQLLTFAILVSGLRALLLLYLRLFVFVLLVFIIVAEYIVGRPGLEP